LGVTASSWNDVSGFALPEMLAQPLACPRERRGIERGRAFVHQLEQQRFGAERVLGSAA
jgi:hypothetical protein